MCRTKLGQGRKQQPKSNHHLDASASESESETYSLFTVVRNKSPDAMQVNLTMNSVPVFMELDTGAAVSLINSATYHRIAQASQLNPLQKSKVTLKTYTGELINTLGWTKALVSCGGKEETLAVHVVEGDGPNLLGRDWITTFKGCVSCLCNLVSTSCAGVEEVLDKHAVVFTEELGALKGFKAKLYVEPNATPRFHRARTIPFALKKSVETELQRLEDENIISPVQFSPWAAPIVPVVKSNGKIRVCGDYKVTINQALQPDSYPLPRVDELFASLSGGRYFSKLDLSNAYLQIELEEESKKFVTINTPKGLFQYNRLPFGISSAPAIFQRCMETLLQGCKGISVYLDDILISGATEEEHLQNLDKVLAILGAAGIKLNRDKCAFLLPKIEYLGHVIDEQGLHPTEEKVKAIKEAPRPKNISELRAFLGIINYYGKFLPNLSTQLAPLHELLQKKAKWSWKEKQDNAFQAAKEALQANSLLVHYDSTKPLVLACDASPQGLGAVLSHITSDGTDRPVAYASRTLSPAERNYSQVEKEGLAVVYGVTKFHNYLYGRHFLIESDHQPLTTLFGAAKEIPPRASSRIQRWALTLSAYRYSIRYKAGTSLGNADALSRLPRPQTTSADRLPGDLVHLINHLSATAVSSASIKTWTDNDPLLSQVKKYVTKGWPQDELPPDFKPYKSRKSELSLLDGCLMWGARVIVPPRGRTLVLEELHETHPGISKMKALARSYVWWPGMDGAIEKVVKCCSSCQTNRPSPPVAQLHPWEWPSEPWSRLHIDFAGPFMGHMYLILVDSHSKWLDAQVMQSITTAKTVEKLRSIFATHGLPKTIVSDNGPSFTSEEFKVFMQSNGIRHIKSAPYHPSTNGLAERAVQTVKQGLRQMKGASVEEKLSKFLHKYRITPHSTTGISPSELLMGRRLRSRLDLLHPDLSGKVEGKQWKQKLAHDTSRTDRKFQEGDGVYAEDFSSTTEKWVPGIVQKVTGPLSYHIQLSDGRVIRRHVDNVRSRSTEDDVTESNAEQSTEDISPALQGVEIEPEPDPEATRVPPAEIRVSIAPTPVTTTVRRSNRAKLPPSYYGHGNAQT